MEGKVAADVGELEGDLLFFAFEGARSVGLLGLEGLFLGDAIELVLFAVGDASFEMLKFTALDDGGGRDSEEPE